MKKKLFSRKLNWMLFKTRVSHIRWMLMEIKLLKICILGMFRIVCPKNDKQYNQLITYVQAYDEIVQTLETEVVSRSRKICTMDNK